MLTFLGIYIYFRVRMRVSKLALFAILKLSPTDNSFFSPKIELERAWKVRFLEACILIKIVKLING